MSSKTPNKVTAADCVAAASKMRETRLTRETKTLFISMMDKVKYARDQGVYKLFSWHVTDKDDFLKASLLAARQQVKDLGFQVTDKTFWGGSGEWSTQIAWPEPKAKSETKPPLLNDKVLIGGSVAITLVAVSIFGIVITFVMGVCGVAVWKLYAAKL